jgi:hypothetical protein
VPEPTAESAPVAPEPLPDLAGLATSVGLSEPGTSVGTAAETPVETPGALHANASVDTAVEAGASDPVPALVGQPATSSGPPHFASDALADAYAQLFAGTSQVLLTDAKPQALLTEAGPVALLAPPEPHFEPEPAHAPAPLGSAFTLAPPEPVRHSAPTAVELAPPLVPEQVPFSELAAPEDSNGPKLPSGSWLQLAPLQDYSAAATLAMHPAAPSSKIFSPDSGPRITLPGPTLPPDLAHFQDANLVTVIGDGKRTGKFRVPGWAVSFLVMLGLLVIGVAIVFWAMPVTHSNAETQPPAVDEANVTAPQPAAHPLAQYIEVTGFRIVVDFNKKSEIHYLIVNHSGAELSDVTIYVTLRDASAKAGQPPLCRFSFRAPALGAFESKEMTSSIDKLSRSVTLPEWPDLRSEVQIGQ